MQDQLQFPLDSRCNDLPPFYLDNRPNRQAMVVARACFLSRNKVYSVIWDPRVRLRLDP
jgi:hypothetical protein